MKLQARPNDFAYDIETYKYAFTCVIVHIATGNRWIFEVSWRRNQAAEFVMFIWWLKSIQARLVGYNNDGFDYPVVHYLLTKGVNFTLDDAYWKAQEVISNQNRNIRSNVYRDIVVEQLDLFKIHHFDNKAKSTGLKALEFAMRSWSIRDLPFDFNSPLDSKMLDTLIAYNCHDVSETIKFYYYTLGMISFREDLSEKMGKSFINYNDTKIGKQYFIDKLEKVLPGVTGTFSNPNQTHRPNGIPVNEIILPYVRFTTPEYQRALDYLRTITIHDTRSPPELKNLVVMSHGFEFVIGAGGLHGSLENKSIYATDEYELHDIDVSSFYPNLAIANRIFPLHLTEVFCDVYKALYEERQTYAKKTSENEMLKLALNGVYGDSNNEYGPFLDPQYTMSITINGQLSLLMLAEALQAIAGVRMIQANTDGVTILVHRDSVAAFKAVCKSWEAVTRLTLEYAQYQAMHIRDVNSYMAVKMDGSVKRIGAYAYVTPVEDIATREVQWHKDHSSLVVPKAAEAYLVRNQSIESFIWQHTDIFDFCVRVKAPRTSTLAFDDGEIIQNTSRVHVSNVGRELFKHMPPLAKNPDKERMIAQLKGWKLHPCNDIREFDWPNLNRQYYIEEAHKLVDKLEKVTRV